MTTASAVSRIARSIKKLKCRRVIYWEPDLPKLEGVEWHVVSDDNSRILKVQTGELDAAIFVPFNRLADLDADPRSTLTSIHRPARTTFCSITRNERLGNKNIRKALNMAIDVKSLVDVVAFGYGTPANSYIPAGALTTTPTIRTIPMIRTRRRRCSKPEVPRA